MEVLDNLPHDRAIFLDGAWKQTVVSSASCQRPLPPDGAMAGGEGVFANSSVHELQGHGPHGGLFEEELENADDKLVQECLKLGEWRGASRPWWRRALDFAVGAGRLSSTGSAHKPFKTRLHVKHSSCAAVFTSDREPFVIG